MLDEIDKKLLNELQINSNRSAMQLSKAINAPRTTVNNRIKKLQQEGYIKGYKAIVNPKKLGKGITVLIHIVITSKKAASLVAEKLKKLPQTEEVYILSGQYDMMAKVRLKDTEELSRFIYDEVKGLRSWEGIERTESMIVLDTIKEHGIIDP